MKKFFVLFLTIITLTLPSAEHAAASEKAGKICQKYRSTSISNGKKYLCVKSGKKLVWNKGVAITLATTVAVTTPVVIKSDLSSTKVINDPITSITINADQKADQVKKIKEWEIAYNKVDRFIVEKTSSTKINFIISPTVDKSRLQVQEDLLNKSFKLWSTLYDPKEVTPWIFTGEDQAWLSNTIQRKDIVKDVTGHYFSNKNSCFFAGVWNTLENSYWLNKNEIYLCMGKGSEDFTFNHHLPHEYTHIVQGNAVKRQNIQQEYPLKCWMTEGVATFYGMAVGFSQDINIKENQRLLFYRSLLQGATASSGIDVVDSLRSGSKEKILPLIKLAEDCSYGNSSNMGYLIGSLMTELLVADHGHESIIGFYKNSSYSEPWEKTFEKSFGVSFDIFCDKLVLYLQNFAHEV